MAQREDKDFLDDSKANLSGSGYLSNDKDYDDLFYRDLRYKIPSGSCLEEMVDSANISEEDKGRYEFEILLDTCSIIAITPRKFGEVLSKKRNPRMNYSVYITTKVHKEYHGHGFGKPKDEYSLNYAFGELEIVVKDYSPSREQVKEIVRACGKSCKKHRTGKDPIEDADIQIIAYAINRDEDGKTVIISQDSHILQTVRELRKPIYNRGKGYKNVYAAKYSS